MPVTGWAAPGSKMSPKMDSPCTVWYAGVVGVAMKVDAAGLEDVVALELNNDRSSSSGLVGVVVGVGLGLVLTCLVSSSGNGSGLVFL